MLPIIIWGEEIFGFILGNKWIQAGTIARIISPLVICGFAAGSVSAVFDFFKKNHIELIWQIFYLLVGLGIIILNLNNDILSTIIYFSIFGSVMYLFLGFLGYRLFKISNR